MFSTTILLARPAFNVVHRRGIRTRGYSQREVPEEDADRILQQLEEQYAKAKERLERDDARRVSGLEFLNNKKPQPEAKRPEKLLEKHATSMWDEIFTQEERQKLKAYKITSLEELRQAHQGAESDLNRPPYPKVDRLKPRSRLAYELHRAIPVRLASKRTRG